MEPEICCNKEMPKSAKQKLNGGFLIKKMVLIKADFFWSLKFAYLIS